MNRLRHLVKEVLARYRVHAIILFGSRARGDWLPTSDYDLLVIADFKSPFLDRISELSALAEGSGLPVEFHPYTMEEVREMLRRGVVSVIDALEEGVTLYEDESFREIREIFSRMKRKGMKRSETTIILPKE